jgi:hypothetical protein
MTPKEKAIELYNTYEVLCRDFTRGVSIKEFAKQSALIAVDEILRLRVNIPYWQEVKKEIENL